MTRFARLLPEFGWDPYVLTVRDEDRGLDEGLDPSRLAGLEHVPITRTRAPGGLLDLYTRAKTALRRRRTNVAVPGAAESGATDLVHPSGEPVAQRLKRYIVSLFVLLPDELKNWAVVASMAAVRLVRRHDIDVVCTSAPPFSVHLVGLVAKRLTGVRWVADFRDPWMEMLPGRSKPTRSRLSDRIEALMEASVMRNADTVLVTTERMRASMASRYPDLPDGRFVCLPNGIDAGTLQPVPPSEKYEPLTVTYAGTLYFDRSPEPLFRAFGELVEQGRARVGDFQIKLVGACRTIGNLSTTDVAARYGVGGAVDLIDPLPYADAFQIMRRSHLLLVLAPPNHQLVLPAKVFDYLGSGSVILGLAEPGATADLMDETGCGRCFSLNDIDGLKAYLAGLLENRAYRDLRTTPETFARYDARRLAARFVEVLAAPTGPADAEAERL